MKQPLILYVNQTLFMTSEREVQANLFLKRPIQDESGQVSFELEEQGIIVMNREYAVEFAKALTMNLEQSALNIQKAKEKNCSEEIKNESK